MNREVSQRITSLAARFPIIFSGLLVIAAKIYGYSENHFRKPHRTKLESPAVRSIPQRQLADPSPSCLFFLSLRLLSSYP